MSAMTAKSSSSPLAEPAAEPIGLDCFYAAEPEGWSEATLTAAVTAQRAERERRLATKARRTAQAKPTATLEAELPQPPA